MEPFFNNKNTKNSITLFLKSITGSELNKRENFIRLIIDEIGDLLNLILLNPAYYDLTAEDTLSREEYLTPLTRHLSKTLMDLNDDSIKDLFIILYRIIIELKLKDKDFNPREALAIEKTVRETHELFSDSHQFEIEWIQKSFPIQIIRNLLYHSEFQNLREYNSSLDQAKAKLNKWDKGTNDLIANWDKKIQQSREKISAQETILNNIQTSLNFVGLNQGFQKLRDQKKRSYNTQLIGLVSLAVVITSLLLAEIQYAMSDNFDVTNLFIIVPSLSLILVILYFFRVLLQNYRSTQSQIMQLDLRMTLCQFIQSYAEYAKEIKEKDKEALSKFENIIFSSIVADDEKIPSTFDGLDQLTQLLNAVKSK